MTKAKRSSALIFRCFLSRQINSLTSAFKTYVRPLVEYSSQIWSPYSIQLVMMIENVQRSFTKRLPGLFNFSYCDRLQFLGLQSLEHRRLLADLTLCYKIIHGLIALDFNDFFALPVHPGLRGHSFKLTVPIVKCNRSKYFFLSRVVPVWNALPAEVVIAPNIFVFRKLVSRVDLSPFLIFPCIVISWVLCFFNCFLSGWLYVFLICLCVFNVLRLYQFLSSHVSFIKDLLINLVVTLCV